MFEFRSPRFGAVPYKIGRFRPDFSIGEVVLHRPYFPTARGFYPLEYPLDELIFTHLLSRRNGVELHGCGVIDHDEGLLFLGFSGAGKSTLARLWGRHSGATILSDDRIILRVRGGRVMMHGTPWHGDEALVAKGPVPLSRLFFLHQGPECAMRPCAGSEAVASMFARCFAPFHCADAIAATLATLEQTVRTRARALISGSLPMTRRLTSFAHAADRALGGQPVPRWRSCWPRSSAATRPSGRSRTAPRSRSFSMPHSSTASCRWSHGRTVGEAR